VKQWIHSRLSENYRHKIKLDNELKRLKKMPRFQETETLINGKTIKVADAASFLFIYDEMFRKEIYKFESSKLNPVIIDCGANIGLSIIYFKQLFPQAEITAFEPDPKIFKILKNNISSLALQNVKVHNTALWKQEGELNFYSEGADAGRLLKDGDKDKPVRVKAVKLSRFIDRPIDMLKIDIEGAEYEVLNECASALHNVQRIFVEYHSFINDDQSLDKILTILKDGGFRYCIQHIGVFSKHPFVRMNSYSGMDLQLNIFAYR
jgi:FkbM family methyltransferase